MQIAIDIPNKDIPKHQEVIDIRLHFIDGHIVDANGYGFVELPKDHGRLIDENVLINNLNRDFLTFERELCYDVEPANALAETFDIIKDAPTIIEADKKYEAKVITRGKCMTCGKELTEGLFFCKECGDKANSRK